MRVVFMGSAPIAVPTMQYLYETHELLAIVTQPDRPFGRKREPRPTAVKAQALASNIPVHEPRKLRSSSFLDTVRALAPDVIVVMAYGRLVPPELLSLPPHGCINLHGSLLPRHRGPCPVERAILEGDPESGITTFYMDEGFDTGDIILQQPIAIAPDETAGSLREKLGRLAVDAIHTTLRAISTNTAPRVPQDLTAGNHAPIITREEAQIPWQWTAEAIDRLVRACEPEPGAYTFFRNQLLKVRRVRAVNTSTDASPGTTVVASRTNGLHLAAGEGTVLAVEEVQPAGKRWMAAADFLSGYRIEAGECFLEMATSRP